MSAGEQPAGRSVGDLTRRVRQKVEVVRRDARRRRMGAPCLAPYGNLFLGPQGEVRACCVSSQYLGNIRVQRLSEIWNGVQQAELRRRLGEGDFSYGCNFCGWERARELAPYARFYDGLDVRSASPAHPTRIEFALSNACNLQCTMCTGEISSAIRLHREGRPPAPKAYGDTFFSDLDAFLPHLRSASFSGGEPFLSAENFRVWEQMERHGATTVVDITTNATQWSRRVQRVLEALRPALQVSIDGTTKATFESIRQGSDFDEVMANVERFLDHARRVGTPVDISHCLMPQNHHEFGDVLLYAEARGMRVYVGVVMTPAENALERLPDDEMAAVLRSLEAQAERVAPHLGGHNARVLVEQVDRVRRWVRDRGDAVPAGTIDYERILGVPRRSAPAPVDGAAGEGSDGGRPGGVEVEAVLARRLDDPRRWLAVGPNDILLDCSPEAAAWLGVDRAALIGVHVERLEARLGDRFGALAPVGGAATEAPTGTVRAAPDEAVAEVVERSFTTEGGHLLRTVGVVVRDRAGWIERVVLGVGHPPG